jgi:hypothetical protein
VICCREFWCFVFQLGYQRYAVFILQNREAVFM